MRDTLRIGIICPSEIAIRRFMPALSTIDHACFCGVGVCREDEREAFDHGTARDPSECVKAQHEKAETFVNTYGGRIFGSYAEVVTSEDIDAVYIPLPPALHYRWASMALQHGKHVLVEKPSTVAASLTKDLVKKAEAKHLALHENYMFIYHSQLDAIDRLLESGEIGDIRLIRISFGFPKRASNDFRYCRRAGGGALLDAGGYTMRYASRFLGDSAEIVQAQANYRDDYEVDLFGSAVMVNADGLTAQLAFGMDNDYRCELEVWGSAGTLYTNRVLTAPAGFEPILRIVRNGAVTERKLEPDDAFRRSICRFMDCVIEEKPRTEDYRLMVRQAELVDAFRHLAGMEQEDSGI